MALLTKKELEEALESLPGWELRGNYLYKKFTFRNFTKAFSFMTEVAFYAEKLNHHPDWENSYNRVEVKLITHDEGGITEKDIQLARKIEEVLAYPKE